MVIYVSRSFTLLGGLMVAFATSFAATQSLPDQAKVITGDVAKKEAQLATQSLVTTTTAAVTKNEQKAAVVTAPSKTDVATIPSTPSLMATANNVQPVALAVATPTVVAKPVITQPAPVVEANALLAAYQMAMARNKIYGILQLNTEFERPSSVLAIGKIIVGLLLVVGAANIAVMVVDQWRNHLEHLGLRIGDRYQEGVSMAVAGLALAEVFILGLLAFDFYGPGIKEVLPNRADALTDEEIRDIIEDFKNEDAGLLQSSEFGYLTAWFRRVDHALCDQEIYAKLPSLDAKLNTVIVGVKDALHEADVLQQKRHPSEQEVDDVTHLVATAFIAFTGRVLTILNDHEQYIKAVD